MDISRKRLLNRLGYSFVDESLLDLALTHRSCGKLNNERLEFLGDAVLGMVVADNLYARFPDLREGDLSRYRSMLVKGTSLAEVARELDLGQHLHLGGGERKSGGHRRDSILADTVEAIIGAIYLDSGIDQARSAIERWLATRIEAVANRANEKDAKTQLQEYLQSKGKNLPSYEVTTVAGEAHDQTFTVSCTVQLLKSPVVASGSSRRAAEQLAAKQALELLNAQ